MLTTDGIVLSSMGASDGKGAPSTTGGNAARAAGMTGAQAATHNAASIRRRRADGVAAKLLASIACIENEKGGPLGPPF